PHEPHQTAASIVPQDLKPLELDPQLDVLSNVLLRDAQPRANLSHVPLHANPMGGPSPVRRFATDQIPSAANRFAGTNRGQFSNQDWDAAGAGLRTALDDGRRLELERDMLKVFTAELPALPYQYELAGIPVTGFSGFIGVTGTAHTGNIMHTTNVNDWDTK